DALVAGPHGRVAHEAVVHDGRVGVGHADAHAHGEELVVGHEPRACGLLDLHAVARADIIVAHDERGGDVVDADAHAAAGADAPARDDVGVGGGAAAGDDAVRGGEVGVPL